MKRFLIIAISLFFAHQAWAQAKPYQITEAPHIRPGYYECKMKESEVVWGEGRSYFTTLQFYILSNGKGEPVIELSICRNTSEYAALCNGIAKNGKDDYAVQIYLDNGEILTSTMNKLYDLRIDALKTSITMGNAELFLYLCHMTSNKKDLPSLGIFQTCQYTSQQLRTHNITKIVINKISIEFGDFKTKETLNKMFGDLGETVKNPDMFRF